MNKPGVYENKSGEQRYAGSASEAVKLAFEGFTRVQETAATPEPVEAPKVVDSDENKSEGDKQPKVPSPAALAKPTEK